MTELEWIPVDSSTVSEVAYDAESEVIYVRFTGGAEYAYEACPFHIWQEFTTPGQSYGKYVNEALKYKPYHKLNP
jgi:hypothetical protein